MRKYENFSKHLNVLIRAPKEDLENEFIISGIIDKFFIQFELGWKLLKELLAYEGKAAAESGSPRQIIKEAYGCYDFIEEVVWLDMLRDRNSAAHIYNEKEAAELVKRILSDYTSAFIKLDTELQKLYGALLRDDKEKRF